MTHAGFNLTRLVVLISGEGSNLQAIIEALQTGLLEATVVGVISDNESAYGLKRANRAGIQSWVLPKLLSQSRSDYDKILADRVESLRPNWVILAGWMRILTSVFLDRFPEHVINLHPALPGAFPGMQAIERAFAAYGRGEIRETGVMIHEVSGGQVDSGPVLAQCKVLIYPNDTLLSLTKRIQKVEHSLLVGVLQSLVNNTV